MDISLRFRVNSWIVLVFACQSLSRCRMKEMCLRGFKVDPGRGFYFSTEIGRRPGDDPLAAERQKDKSLAAHQFGYVNAGGQPAVLWDCRNANMLRTNTKQHSLSRIQSIKTRKLRFIQGEKKSRQW